MVKMQPAETGVCNQDEIRCYGTRRLVLYPAGSAR